jgi:hypothetical protein
MEKIETDFITAGGLLNAKPLDAAPVNHRKENDPWQIF